MNLIPSAKEHPLRERLIALSERLQSQVDNVNALKQKIIDRLLAWQKNIEATKLDSVGTFVVTGVRERLQSLVPNMINDAIEIDAQGWVNLHDGIGELHLGSIHVPWSDEWARQEFVNRNCLSDVERMTFNPTSCTRYIDPKEATLESLGGFQFSDNDADTARIVMGTDYVRRYAAIAQIIHTGEEAGAYRNDRVMMNLQDAFRACTWLEEHLPEAVAIDAKSTLLLENDEVLLNH
jgi:hypothetical protein